jgi:hypothetical protein
MRRVLAVVLVVFLLPGLALAHEQSDLDANDSEGPLDTVAARLWDRGFCTVTMPHGDEAQRERCYTEIQLKLVTYEPWSSEVLAEPNGFISFEFNLDADDAIERCVVILTPAQPDDPADPMPARPQGTIYRNCDYSDDVFVRDVGRVRRPDNHSIRILLRKDRLLPRGTGSFRWRSVTSYERQGDQACGSQGPPTDGGYGACADLTAWRRHRR